MTLNSFAVEAHARKAPQYIPVLRKTPPQVSLGEM